VKLHEEFEVSDTVASVWTFFDLPAQVAGCVPGVEDLTVVDRDHVEVQLSQSIGPLSATFAATVRIIERIPERSIAFTATGKSVRGAVGNVRAAVTVQLQPLEGRTAVLVDADVVLAGALGSVGQKVIAKQVGKVTAQFARNLELALDESGLARRDSAGASGDRQEVINQPSAWPRGSQSWGKLAAALSVLSMVLSVVALWRGRRGLTR
jgi:carbon monoxide dehydrogenase subunit G